MTQTTTSQYTIAGWLAIGSAILLVPEVGLAFLAGLISSSLNLLLVPIHTINLVIGVYILYMFRRLLNQQFDFHAADILITVLIVVNIVFFFIGLAEIFMGALGLDLDTERLLTLITLTLFVPFSILTIIFGAVLLKLKDDLFGLLKPYAYTTIASGALGATVILAPFGLIAAAIALMMLGMIFLRADRETEIL